MASTEQDIYTCPTCNRQMTELSAETEGAESLAAQLAAEVERLTAKNAKRTMALEWLRDNTPHNAACLVRREGGGTCSCLTGKIELVIADALAVKTETATEAQEADDG